LSAMDGRKYRLPTEAEWEYACRAGRSTAYSFGAGSQQLGSYAWFGENAFDAGEKYAHETGTKKANDFGLYDMHGNVWEWCADWHGYYISGQTTDPLGALSGLQRVSRGGAWDFSAGHCRSACRSNSLPSFRGSDLGFRLALSPSGE
jgi:formylglycine-generating enzyme required for sulfatase activity